MRGKLKPVKLFCFWMSILTMATACRKKECQFPVTFQISAVRPGTTIDLDLDSGGFKKRYNFRKAFIHGYKKSLILVDSYCSTNEKISVKVTINGKYDTLFQIDQHEIEGCFVGDKWNGRIRIFYRYYEGGLRENGYDS